MINKRFRTADHERSSFAPEARRCDVPGCPRSTRERKPFCPDHVERHGYVQGLVERLERRDDELRRVARVGVRAVDPCGITAQDIILQMRLYGNRTVPRLSRDLALEEKVVAHYAKALARRGVLSIGRTSRGLALLVPGNLDVASKDDCQRNDVA